MASVLWLQGGACNGNTMSLLDAEEPTVVDGHARRELLRLVVDGSV